MSVNEASDSAIDALLSVDESASVPSGKPSRVRYWILGQFMCFTMIQSFAWAIPGAITEALMDPGVYNVSQFTTELWLLWGGVFFVLGAIPFSYWLDLPGGLRGSTVFSIALVVVGCVIRVIVRDSSALSVALLHISYVLNGIAGVVSMGAVGKISEDWFPPHERGSATAWGSEANPFGAAIVFLVGPAMVSTIDMAHVQNLNYFVLALSIINFLCVLVFYPSHPNSAPSASASVARTAESQFTLKVLWGSLVTLSKSKECVLLFAAYGLTQGFSSGWTSTLQPNLAPFLVNDSASDIQWRAGLISFASCTTGNVGGVILGSYIDRFRGHRTILIGFNAIAALFFFGFAVVVAGYTPLSNSAAYNALFWSGTIGGFFSMAAIPLYFELCLEAAFPLPTGTVIIILTTMMNASSIVFYLIPIGSWVNFALAGVLAFVSIILAFFFDDKAKRARFDATAAAEAGAELTSAERALIASERKDAGLFTIDSK